MFVEHVLKPGYLQQPILQKFWDFELNVRHPQMTFFYQRFFLSSLVVYI